MSIYSFIADVGKKIFGKDEDDTNKRDILHKEVGDLDLPAHLSIEVEGKTVKLGGNVPDTITKEKVILALGNIEGIAEVEDDIVAAKEEISATFITVSSGDTLWKIAEQSYGDGSKYSIIFEANKPMLKSADAIFPGQKLRIPSLEEA